MRQALLYALDRELIAARAGWRQFAEVAHTWVPPADAGHRPGVRRYHQDVDTAHRLLAEAAWAPGPDGIARNSAGDRLELVISTTPGNEPREHTQDLLIEPWRAIGAALRKDNPPDFFQRVHARRFQLPMFAWVLAPQTDGFFLWHSSQIPPQANPSKAAATLVGATLKTTACSSKPLRNSPRGAGQTSSAGSRSSG